MPFYHVDGLPKGHFITEPKKPTKPEVQCLVRSLLNTPHGPAFLHLYRNNMDNKEHLALVFDKQQLNEAGTAADTFRIRSSSLDEIWTEEESVMDRIVRGAYTGKLTPESKVPSVPSQPESSNEVTTLVRIHSHCYTGEILLNDRCDCRQQVDEAMRILGSAGENGKDPRGVLIYLMQEGRGIGLLSKLRAYNIQDCGHTDDEANIMLGHCSDERSYAVAAEILRDLGVASSVQLLTSNEGKVSGLREEGVNVVGTIPI